MNSTAESKEREGRDSTEEGQDLHEIKKNKVKDGKEL